MEFVWKLSFNSQKMITVLNTDMSMLKENGILNSLLVARKFAKSVMKDMN